MAQCRACGGLLGRDCFNEHDCLQISYSNADYFNEDNSQPLYDELESNHYAFMEYERKIEILKDLLIKNNIPIPDLSSGNLYYYGLTTNQL